MDSLSAASVKTSDCSISAHSLPSPAFERPPQEWRPTRDHKLLTPSVPFSSSTPFQKSGYLQSLFVRRVDFAGLYANEAIPNAGSGCGWRVELRSPVRPRAVTGVTSLPQEGTVSNPRADISRVNRTRPELCICMSMNQVRCKLKHKTFLCNVQ